MDAEQHVFPHPSGAQGCDGITLRDWFAGQAIAGWVSQEWNAEEAARVAYQAADAMMAERNRRADDGR